jgi:uncharacterized RDD family membrane protein YckC
MHRKGSGELSSSVSQPAPKPSWKQEVDRRLQAHKSRKGLSVVEENAQPAEHAGVSDRAATAAARVAARFSKAPSYSEMQAAEARAALRDAETATRAALEAQVVAQAALANLERAHEENIECEAGPWEPAATNAIAERAWDSIDSPSASSGASSSEFPVSEMSQVGGTENWHAEDARPEEADFGHWVDAQPIHANLIRFPRELVATRRVRPRLTGASEPLATEHLEHRGQLSIFEVDPNTISIEPTASTAVETASPAPSWSGPEWSNIELERDRDEVEEFHGEPPSTSSGLDLAPLELRLMAATIDFALVVGLVCAGAVGIAGHMSHAPAIKVAEMMAFSALSLTGVLYQAFFLMATMSTPGMMYAGISLCTFDDEHPTRAQLRDRLGALLVSLLPVGLGLAWSIFDEDRLCWHDRISRTYQRKC